METLKTSRELQTDLWTKEITLEGALVRLAPTGLAHLQSLSCNILYPRYWVDDFGGCISPEDVEKEIRHSLQARQDRLENGFTMIDKKTGEAIGLTNYLYFNRKLKGLEIGRTRVGISWHKTSANTEAKLLLMTYAFETLGCQRVGFKVDSLNFNSQRAVKRIGGKFEGEIRNYMLLPDGRKRDYHSYSIIDSEWLNVKKTLQGYLEKYYVSPESL
ncbi:GNAT family N-acetyltransferase [Bdellovibrio svalbardensis]|uniref:GNAT family N-acetyltransferase n=1 Tax=Bdellovibrio svalbardensis TaxID=2972972 RepID=A0ABT6DMK8_9BACT|nr:GNAT family protein [Bdellovibrio svalbardensis]MDG0817742.1 GNAT family N-acetyltransferase [Bdellovibrio svalbardensis]